MTNSTQSAGTSDAVLISGIRFMPWGEEEAAANVVAAGAQGTGLWLVTANVDHVRQYQADRQVRRLIDAADAVVADGTPLVWASRLAGHRLPERVAGSNLIYLIARRAAESGAPVFFVGGDAGAAERCVEELSRRYPEMRVAGIERPMVAAEAVGGIAEQLVEQFRETAPAIVLVALGFPKQDLLIEQMRKLDPRPSYVGLGISFSFVAGDVRRAPKWTHQLGLEWIHRLWQEPSRLADRYLRHDLPFAVRIFTDVARARLGRRNTTPSPSDHENEA